MMRRVVLTAVAVLLVIGTRAPADGWGHIKGQVVLDEPKILPPAEVNVNKDQEHCLSKGKIYSEEYVVDPRSKGVRWVMVWIALDKDDKADHLAKMPLHESVAEIKQKSVEMDQPCCRFEPRMIGLRKGQDFIACNSSPISHNMAINGSKGPNVNPLLTPGDRKTIEAAKWNPYFLPASVTCGIHGWMQAKVFCFSHPYFCVTDKDGKFEIKNVPAGKLRLFAWHEGPGMLLIEEGKHFSAGKGITVEDGKTLEIKVPMKYEKKD
jgi:hypothetical protein